MDSRIAALEAAIGAILSAKAAMKGEVNLDVRSLSSTLLREESEGWWLACLAVYRSLKNYQHSAESPAKTYKSRKEKKYSPHRQDYRPDFYYFSNESGNKLPTLTLPEVILGNFWLLVSL